MYASIEKLKDDKGMPLPHARALPPPRRGMAWHDCDRTQAHQDMMWCRAHWFCHLGYLMMGVSEVLRVSAFVMTGVTYLMIGFKNFREFLLVVIGVTRSFCFSIRVSVFLLR